MAKRKIEADPLLNPRLKRHLKAIGVKSVSEYRMWCSEHGFRSELSKNLTQLDDEVRAAKSDIRQSTADSGLSAHFEKLGLSDIHSYQAWCRSVGVGEGLNKSASLRRKEIRLKESSDFEQSQSRYLSGRENLADIIKNIAHDRFDSDLLTNPALRRVALLFRRPDCSEERNSLFLDLLTAVLPKSDFLDVNPVISQYGRTGSNTLIDGLYAVTGHPIAWIRSPHAWEPSTKSLTGRFAELVRHLFSHYTVPAFMDSVWFSGLDGFAHEQQRWFIHIGQGGNIRKAGLPMVYTKRMAHEFMQSDDQCTAMEAIRWGQVAALGGSRELHGHICATHLGEGLGHEEFWSSVIHFFINNPMLDLAYVGPVIDYINHRKFLPEMVTQEDGTVAEQDPPDPQFSMKGRRPEPLVELVDTWHALLTRVERKRTGTNWAPSGFTSYEFIEEDESTGHLMKWSVQELLTRKAIFDEGKAMKHCVRSYIPSCVRGIQSVWSLTREDTQEGRTKKVLTIAVKNDTKKVVQARGKCNAMPGMRPNSAQEAGVLKREEALLLAGRKIMKMWGAENDIVVPRYT